MKTFQEWLEDKHPDYRVDEGVLDSLGRSKFVRGAVTAAGLAAGAMRGMPHSSAAGVQVSPGVVVYDGKEGDEKIAQATAEQQQENLRMVLQGRVPSDPEAAMMIGKLNSDDPNKASNDTEVNRYINTPEEAPEYLKPFLFMWHYRSAMQRQGNLGVKEAGRFTEFHFGKIERLKKSTDLDLVRISKKFDPGFEVAKDGGANWTTYRR